MPHSHAGEIPHIFQAEHSGEKRNGHEAEGKGTRIEGSEAAFEMSRQIVKNEGIFVGMSSGAAMLAATEVAKKLDSGKIVVIFPDRGEKYLSTKLFRCGEL